MSRDLTTPMIQGLTSINPAVCILLDLTLKSSVEHIWTGLGTISWNGNDYRGIGDLGGMGDIPESTEVKAEGTTIALSGVNPDLLAESLADIQLGAPVTIWFALFDLVTGLLVDAPYRIFKGTVGKPSIPITPDSLTISLSLENKMIQLQRPTSRRYTASDQRYEYPNDTGFNWVETLADIALRWGS